MSSEIPEIFKALLEDPFTVPTFDYNDNDKDKLFTGDNVDLGGGSGMGPSAALTPAIWDKTIPYNLETFHLEYMDLEEFLIENGIPTLSLDKKPTSTTTAPAAPISLLPVLELDQCEEEVVTITLNSADITANTEVVTDKDRLTPETIDPEEIEVNVNFDPDPTDLVLSSVPGGELFNPRKHKFSEEELKPQPMIKKAKKVYVPEDSKEQCEFVHEADADAVRLEFRHQVEDPCPLSLVSLTVGKEGRDGPREADPLLLSPSLR